MPWLGVDSEELPAVWPGALDVPEEGLALLLDAAREQCEAYAPRLAPDAPVPARYRQAQALQARALWQAGQTDQGGEIGGAGYQLPTFPMDWAIKNLLRPKTRPVVR